jgi:hypothetical protein
VNTDTRIVQVVEHIPAYVTPFLYHQDLLTCIGKHPGDGGTSQS